MFLPAVFCNEVVFYFHLLGQTLPEPVVARLAEYRWTIYTKWIRIAANITATVLAAVGMWEAAGYVFLGSVILWAFMYLWIAEEWHTLVTDEDTDDIEATFFAVHVGALNFLLDVPGIESKHARGAHYIIVLSNVVAAIALTIGLSVSEPLDAAWGCYPPDAPLSAGMCASAFQICDPPLKCPWMDAPACKLTHALRNCGVDALSGEVRETFRPFRSVGLSALFLSASVYFLSYGDKTRDLF